MRTAYGFFDSVLDLASEFLSMVEVEQALVVEEIALEHSLAMCPVLPQNRQRFCLKQCCCSACVSLPSFPSFEKRLELGFFWLVLLLPVLVLLELLFLLLLFLFLSAF